MHLSSLSLEVDLWWLNETAADADGWFRLEVHAMSWLRNVL